MANTITRTLLVDGESKYTVHFSIVGDGSGDETGTRVNVITGDMGTNAAIESITGGLSGFSARILFDATADVLAMQLPSDADLNYDFTKYGGIKNFSGAGKTGDILITTSGVGNGDSGVLIITVRK